MTQKKQTGGLDYFKPAAALFVAAIHTSPFTSFSADVDFIFTRIIARTAVPFFFMTTGYFLLPQYLFRHSMDHRPLIRAVKKLFFLYLAAILLYLPVNLLAGQLKGVSAGGFLRMVLTDGTFYHLWYLPAVLWGIVFVFFMSGGCRQSGRISFGGLAGITVVLYVIGLFGDSYYGLTEQMPFLKEIYTALFSVSSYTRNGAFFAPLFLVMGAGIYESGSGRKTLERKRQKKAEKSKNADTLVCAIGFVISLVLMTAEGMTLHRLNLQRHDSMYFMLPAVMFFLFGLLLSIKCAPVKRLREISLWIYLLHPLCIIIVRGGAKAARLERIFIDNSLLHYLAVCAASLAAAIAATVCVNRISGGFFLLRGQNQAYAKGRAWIELSRENLAKNVETLQSMLMPGQQLMPVVKADAYGHGAALVARELQNMGIKAFGVACVSEGTALRKDGITGDILILGYTHPEDFPLLYKYCLTQTVVDDTYGEALNNYGKKLNVHLKIDTGMRRLGERSEKSGEIGGIFRLKNLHVTGVYTHLCADETRNPRDMEFTKKQAELFYEAVEKPEVQGISGLKTHLLASYGLLNYPELGGDYVRVGIALYGLFRDDRAGLLSVLSLRARIAVVKDLYQGESAGYGLAYTAESDRKIAVLSIGYADGLPRMLSNGRGRVLIHGQSAPVIGWICMDQTIVDITGIPDVKAGETAVLFGKAGDAEITAYEWAQEAETIPNEILSRLGARLPRFVTLSPAAAPDRAVPLL